MVRNTGGLADTVFDVHYSAKPSEERNGFVFNDYNQAGLESALRRAIGLWFDYPEVFQQLMANGMRYDYSWRGPAQHYCNIYDLIREPGSGGGEERRSVGASERESVRA